MYTQLSEQYVYTHWERAEAKALRQGSTSSFGFNAGLDCNMPFIQAGERGGQWHSALFRRLTDILSQTYASVAMLVILCTSEDIQ